MDRLCYEVEPGFLCGRPGPATKRWDLDFLKAHGTRVIVSLVHDVDAEEIRRTGITHYSLPIDEKIRRPFRTANSFLFPLLAKFDEIVERHRAAGERILVHCNAGKDRTGLVLGYYLLTRGGLPAKRVIKRLRELRPDALTAKGFEAGFLALADAFLEQWSRGKPV